MTARCRFTVVSQLEDKEVGFSAEEGDFDYIPDSIVGKVWPSIFGKVMDVPALRFTDAIRGTNLCGVGIITGSTRTIVSGNASPFDNAITQSQASLGVSMAQMQAQRTHVGRVRGAYQEAAAATNYVDYHRQAARLLEQWNDINQQMTEVASQAESQEQCQRARQRQAGSQNTNTYKLGCNPVQILGGEDFPRGEIWLDIGGGHFRGRFGETEETKDIFTISDRYHEEDTEAFNEEVANAIESTRQVTDPPECQATSPRAHWNYQTNVPKGYGDVGSDLVTTKGFTVVTKPISSSYGQTAVVSPKQFWADSGASVTLVKDIPIEYIVSITPGQVLAVKAYKTIDAKRVLAAVPHAYWKQGSKQYGPITAVTVEISKTLSNLKDQGWEDDIYVTFESTIGPNTVDIMKYLIDTYSDLTYDETSFTTVHAKLARFPANFALLTRKNLVEVLQEIAFQARCALWIKDGIFYLKYLPEEPAADDTITLSDIDAENSIVTELTSTEDLVTKMRIKWRLNYSEEGQRLLLLRHNVKKYGIHEQEYDYYIYNQPDIVLKMATFWLIRKANTWKRVKFSTFLNKLNLETFDCVTLAFGETYVANADVKSIVESAHYNSESHRIDFECWTPVKSGEMEPYELAWPASSDLTFPTVQEIQDGFAGGDGIGADAKGRLPVGKFSIGDSTVWVGGPNIVFKGHSDWGDPKPGDIDFTAQTVVDTEVYANLSKIPPPDPPQGTTYQDPYPAIQTWQTLTQSPDELILPLINPPAGAFAIDIRNTRLVDSSSDSPEEGATLDSIIHSITDGDIKLKTSVLFADAEHEEGAEFHFKYDNDAKRFAAGSAFLLGSEN